MNTILYKLTLVPELKISLLSSLIAFNFGTNNPHRIIADINNDTKTLLETSALENPPVKIRVIAYDFKGFNKIRKDIKAPVKRFTDNPIKISLVMENFENPLRIITRAAANKAPKKPNKE